MRYAIDVCSEGCINPQYVMHRLVSSNLEVNNT